MKKVAGTFEIEWFSKYNGIPMSNRGLTSSNIGDVDDYRDL
jgi:hypothetical protein